MILRDVKKILKSFQSEDQDLQCSMDSMNKHLIEQRFKKIKFVCLQEKIVLLLHFRLRLFWLKTILGNRFTPRSVFGYARKIWSNGK